MQGAEERGAQRTPWYVSTAATKATTQHMRPYHRPGDAYVAQIDNGGLKAPRRLPPVLHAAYVVQLLQLMREYGRRLSAVRSAVDEYLAAQNMTSEDAIRSEHQRQAAAQVSVANVITSLRLCSTLDWSQYFEAVSAVERVQQRDPDGAYVNLDFLNRDRYRQAVEELAEPTGEPQLLVALRAIGRARLAAESGSDRAAHIGHHLIGKGRRDLETDLADDPRLTKRIRRFVFAHSTSAYLGSIVLATALLLGLGLAYVRHLGASVWAQVERRMPFRVSPRLPPDRCPKSTPHNGTLTSFERSP